MLDDLVEEIAIEAVSVGDFVHVAPPTRHVDARCVMAKRAKSNARTERIVGWLVELAGGELVWLSHGTKLWRRRTVPRTR